MGSDAGAVDWPNSFDNAISLSRIVALLDCSLSEKRQFWDSKPELPYFKRYFVRGEDGC